MGVRGGRGRGQGRGMSREAGVAVGEGRGGGGGVRSCCVEGAGGWKISRPYGGVGVGHLPSSHALTYVRTHARLPPPPRTSCIKMMPKYRKSNLIDFISAENNIRCSFVMQGRKRVLG